MSMRRPLRLVVLMALLTALLSARPAAAAGEAAAATPALPASTAARPRIGLVLSGGGARGAAHIGVLKVLEELRVPVDLIVGTSMGSIVGASYATGMSVAEMEEAIGAITTKGLFNDRAPRADLSLRQKTDDLTPYLIPEIGIGKDGVELPKGLVTGVALEGELRGLVQVSSARDFNDLPIPFRAVATDIGTGEMVVLKEGSVVRAIRASMSVPGAVAPVTIGKRQLVDGGLVRNLPVDVARAMGADIIIAVNLGTPLLKPDEITSVLSVTAQMINILTEQNVARSLKELRPQDILIVPELGDFSSADFDHLPKAVPIGEAAARQVAGRLSALSLPPQAYAELRRKQAAPAGADAVVVQAIRVEGARRVSEEVVLQSMRTQVGDTLDRDTIDLDMRRIYSRGDFETVNYTIDEVDGQRTLVVLVKEKPARDYFRFGLAMEANLGKQAGFDLYASHRRKWINKWGAEWRNDLVLGSDVLLSTELYQPIGERQHFFVAPKLRYSITPFYIFYGNTQIARYQDSNWIADFDIGANIIEYGEVRIGASAGQRNFRFQSGDLLFPQRLQQNIGGVQLSARFDRLDNVNFPHDGYLATGRIYSSLAQLGADETYNKWELGLNGASTWGRHTLDAAFSAGGSLGGNDLPVTDTFPLGGFLYLSGLQRQQLRAQEFDFARLVYRTKLADFPVFDGLYAGASLEGARLKPTLATMWGGDLKTGRFNVPAGSVFLGVDSPLGPVYLGFGYANRDNKAVYLFIGRP
ncbi:MAG TPA: patatin-like phospholipase family protein [Rubrivivax sp.]|nr:patatin-like phospholipase family protein [Rubrivivax sp.]